MSALINKIFPNVNSDVRAGSVDTETAKSIAEKVLQELTPYPMDCAFLFGSSINGNFKPYSDIVAIIDGDNYWHKLMRVL